MQPAQTAHCDFPQPFALQFAGSTLARWLLQRLGWRVSFSGLPGLQGVFAVYPHTSNWDFIVLVLVKWSIGVPVRFWAKDALFRIPGFGHWLRYLGGVGVDRHSPQGLVGQTVAHFERCKAQGRYFWLALTPEGTRKATLGWRSGFYQTTVQAQVPLCLVRLDYARQEVTLQDFIVLKGEPEPDFARIAAAYAGVQGCRQRNAAPIRLLGAAQPQARKVGQ